MAGAPIGNTNASKGRPWRDAITRALETRTKSRIDGKRELDELANKLLDAAAAGDLGALGMLGDRLDGKPAQAIVGDDSADPVRIMVYTGVPPTEIAPDAAG